MFFILVNVCVVDYCKGVCVGVMLMSLRVPEVQIEEIEEMDDELKKQHKAVSLLKSVSVDNILVEQYPA